MIFYILIAILLFGFLVAAHEFGHFLAAKAAGVRVNEFSIGIGPALLQRQGKDTLYSLRLLPIGGFCAMEGEDGGSQDPKSFEAQSGWKKFIILIAGCVMNFVVGLLLVVLLYSGMHAFYTTTIRGFMDGFPLQGESMLMEGDELVRIDGERVYVYSDIPTLLGLSNGETVDLVVRRDGELVKLDDLPLTLREYPAVDGGTQLKYGLLFGVEEATLANKLEYSWKTTVDFARMVRLSLKEILSGGVSAKEVSGVIGIVDTMSEMGESAANWADRIYDLVYFGAFIAVNLAVMNLLPIPALDGGRIFFLLVNGIYTLFTKRKVDPKYEGYIHTAGFALLMVLMVVLAVNDVVKIVVR